MLKKLKLNASMKDYKIFWTNTPKRCPFHYRGREGRELAQSYPTLWYPMDCSPPGSSIHGIFQARVLEWVAISFSRGSSPPRNRTWVSCIVGRHFTVWATREVLHYRVLECKSRKSRDTWSNSKFGHGVQNETGQRLTECCQENALVIANILFQLPKRWLHVDITRWSIPKSDWLYLQPKMEKLYTASKYKTRSWLWLRSWTPYYQIHLNWRK